MRAQALAAIMRWHFHDGKKSLYYFPESSNGVMSQASCQRQLRSLCSLLDFVNPFSAAIVILLFFFKQKYVHQK